MIKFIRGSSSLAKSIYGQPVTAGSVNLTGKQYKNVPFTAWLSY